MRIVFALIVTAVLTACAAYGPQRAAPQDVAALAAQVRALSPEIDPAEAQAAARLAYETTFALAVSYQITDPPIFTIPR